MLNLTYMFIQLTILYPLKSSYKKLIKLLNNEKEDFVASNKCIEYSIYKDTYSNKIINIIKWKSKDIMKDSIDDKEHENRVKSILDLQKFPPEVYYLEE